MKDLIKKVVSARQNVLFNKEQLDVLKTIYNEAMEEAEKKLRAEDPIFDAVCNGIYSTTKDLEGANEELAKVTAELKERGEKENVDGVVSVEGGNVKFSRSEIVDISDTDAFKEYAVEAGIYPELINKATWSKTKVKSFLKDLEIKGEILEFVGLKEQLALKISID